MDKIVFNEVKKFDLYTIFANPRGILLSKCHFVIKKEGNIKYNNLKIILILDCTCFSNFYKITLQPFFKGCLS